MIVRSAVRQCQDSAWRMRAIRYLARLTMISFALIALPSGAGDPVYGEYMRRSGLWEQLGQLQDFIRKGIEQSAPQPSAIREAVLEQAMAAYHPDRLRREIETQLADRLVADDARMVLAWYDSDLGKRFTRAEVEASSKEGHDRVQERAAEVFSALAPARRAVLQQLLAASGGAEALAAILVNQHQGLARGAALATGQPLPRSVETGTAQQALQKAQLAGALQPMLLANFAVVYGGSTDAELSEYLAALQTTSGQRVTAATIGALDEVLSAAATRFGEGLARKALEEQRPRT